MTNHESKSVRLLAVLLLDSCCPTMPAAMRLNSMAIVASAPSLRIVQGLCVARVTAIGSHALSLVPYGRDSGCTKWSNSSPSSSAGSPHFLVLKGVATMPVPSDDTSGYAS